MLEVTRIKKTGQIVHPIGPQGSGYTLCLFPRDSKTRAGNMGVVQTVKNENLTKDREGLF